MILTSVPLHCTRLLAWYEDLDVGPITALTFTSPRYRIPATLLRKRCAFSCALCSYAHVCYLRY